MYLETDRMILRNFTISDLDDLYEIFSDADVMKDIETPYDWEKTKMFLKSFCIERNPNGAFAAILKQTGKVIGYVLFKSVDEPEIFEIGWIFNKNYWRNGYAYEICNRLICYGFETMGLHKIIAKAIDNIKSVSLMKKLGMELEGVHTNHSKSHDGIWYDLYLYAINNKIFQK